MFDLNVFLPLAQVARIYHEHVNTWIADLHTNMVEKLELIVNCTSAQLCFVTNTQNLEKQIAASSQLTFDINRKKSINEK